MSIVVSLGPACWESGNHPDRCCAEIHQTFIFFQDFYIATMYGTDVPGTTMQNPVHTDVELASPSEESASKDSPGSVETQPTAPASPTTSKTATVTVIITFNEETNAAGLKKIPCEVFWIYVVPGTRTWSLGTKIVLALQYLFYIIMIGVSSYMYATKFEKLLENDDSNDDYVHHDDDANRDCPSTQKNEEFAIRLLFSCLSLLMKVIPCFRQYLFHMRNYEWPFMKLSTINGIPAFKYVQKNGGLGYCNPHCCESWFLASGLAALWNMVVWILWLATFIEVCGLIGSADSSDTCRECEQLADAYAAYMACAVFAGISYSLNLTRFMF